MNRPDYPAHGRLGQDNGRYRRAELGLDAVRN
jgi:hypothetical protein